jgi:hypothetical protein
MKCHCAGRCPGTHRNILFVGGPSFLLWQKECTHFLCIAGENIKYFNHLEKSFAVSYKDKHPFTAQLSHHTFGCIYWESEMLWSHNNLSKTNRKNWQDLKCLQWMNE